MSLYGRSSYYDTYAWKEARERDLRDLRDAEKRRQKETIDELQRELTPEGKKALDDLCRSLFPEDYPDESKQITLTRFDLGTTYLQHALRSTAYKVLYDLYSRLGLDIPIKDLQRLGHAESRDWMFLHHFVRSHFSAVKRLLAEKGVKVEYPSFTHGTSAAVIYDSWIEAIETAVREKNVGVAHGKVLTVFSKMSGFTGHVKNEIAPAGALGIKDGHPVVSNGSEWKSITLTKKGAEVEIAVDPDLVASIEAEKERQRIETMKRETAAAVKSGQAIGEGPDGLPLAVSFDRCLERGDYISATDSRKRGDAVFLGIWMALKIEEPFKYRSDPTITEATRAAITEERIEIIERHVRSKGLDFTFPKKETWADHWTVGGVNYAIHSLVYAINTRSAESMAVAPLLTPPPVLYTREEIHIIKACRVLMERAHTVDTEPIKRLMKQVDEYMYFGIMTIFLLHMVGLWIIDSWVINLVIYPLYGAAVAAKPALRRYRKYVKAKAETTRPHYGDLTPAEFADKYLLPLKYDNHMMDSSSTPVMMPMST